MSPSNDPSGPLRCLAATERLGMIDHLRSFLRARRNSFPEKTLGKLRETRPKTTGKQREVQRERTGDCGKGQGRSRDMFPSVDTSFVFSIASLYEGNMNARSGYMTEIAAFASRYR